jgi:glutathione S-transferase
MIFSKVRAKMTELMNINGESAKQSEALGLTALNRLDDLLKNRRYVGGDRFSRADLTACGLLSP